MKDYSLQPNEVLLYEGHACRTGDGEESVDLLLTNLNLVLISMQSQENVQVTAMPMNQIKVYEGVPQILQKGCDVHLFFIDGEVSLGFTDKNEMRKFISAVKTLLTGKSTVMRGAEKVNNAVGIVNSALGINTMDAVKGVLENGISKSIIGKLRKKHPIKGNAVLLARDAIGAAKDIFGKKETPGTVGIAQGSMQVLAEKQPEAAFDDKVASLKKLKELLDMGILTQEEFEAKKAEIISTL